MNNIKIPWHIAKQIPTYVTDMYQVKHGRRPKKAIDTVLHLTMNCNLRCEYCYIAHDTNLFPKKYEGSGLSKEDIHKILWNIKKNSIAVTFFGGEPFIRKDLVDLLQYAKEEVGMPLVNITTNGTLIKQKKEGLPYIDVLGISYDQTRIQQYPVKMKTMLMDLELLAREGYTNNVVFDVTLKDTDDVSQLYPFFDYCTHNGFKVFLQPVRHENKVYEWKAYKKQFNQAFDRHGNMLITNNKKIVDQLDAKFIKEQCIPNIKYIIDVDGQLIYPCERFFNQKAGNCIDTDIGQLYKKAEQKYGVFPNKRCGECGMQCYPELATIYRKPSFVLSKAYSQFFNR